MRFLCALFFATTPLLFAASPGPALHVDAAAGRHPISPDIYGINEYSDNGLANIMRISVRRWGGDAATRYNWLNDTFNSAADWYFETQVYNWNATSLPDGSAFDQFEEQNLSSGTRSIGTIPMLDWRTKARDTSCSYSVSKYGAQQQASPDRGGDCGNGFMANGSKVDNNPADASTPTDPSYQQQWLQYLVKKYSTGARGGLQIWNLDNEPEWWDAVHMDIHPVPATYDEMLSRATTYGQLIKGVDPTALVTGPVAGGWSGCFYSSKDMNAGWSVPPYEYWDNPVDRNAHGGIALVDWYLQQMQQYEKQHGQRLLDYLDVHAYIAPNLPGSSTSISFGSAGSDAVNALRLTSTRVFWDPNYTVPNNDQIILVGSDGTAAQAAPQLAPRMLSWVRNDYPGTKTAITEYNWGALDDITGAIAQADILGIFGRESLDLATLWAPPQATDPGAFAFLFYLNYDGEGGRFGETSVSATTGNPDQLSIFAAQRSDNALTVLVLNKTTGDLTSTVEVSSFTPSGTAQVYQYSKANLSAIVREADATIGSGGISATFPAYSMTLFVIPARTTSVQPVITAVKNAASYDAHAVSPGEVIALQGTNLGPATIAPAAVTADGNYLTNNAAGVRVLFDGVAAPLVYEWNSQVAAIVPYFTALQPVTHVAIEYNGVRSAAVSVPVTATVPAVFTNDFSGKGQGAIVNPDYTRNSSAHPAHAGDWVMIFGTGEGQTNPPGVDGRLALDLLPKVAATCAVTIGGVSANVNYCGAAPNYTAGLLQVNAQVPSGVSVDAVSLDITIGGVSSQSGVTMAVR